MIIERRFQHFIIIYHIYFIKKVTVNPCYLTHGVKSRQKKFAISKSFKLNLKLSEVANFFDLTLPHGLNNKVLRYLLIEHKYRLVYLFKFFRSILLVYF